MNAAEKYGVLSYIASVKAQLGICVMKNNGEGCGYQHRLIFPSACCIKSFIMLEYVRLLAARCICGQERLVYTKGNYADGPGKIKYLSFGTEVSLAELTELMITKSDHIAANMLIDFFSISQINHTIADFGFQNTILNYKFYPHTLHRVGQTTPYELALFYNRVNNYELIGVESCELMKKILLKQKFKDILIEKIISKGSTDYINVASKSGKVGRSSYSQSGCIGDSGILFTSRGSYSIALLSEIPADSPETVETVKAVLQKISFNIFKGMVNEL